MHEPIFAFVGKSGSGKSTCILKLIDHFGRAKLDIVKSLTTRAPREDPSDPLFYEFVSQNEVARMSVAGQIIQQDKYAGEIYASSYEAVERITGQCHGICALTERGVLNFRAAGYLIYAIQLRANRVTTSNAARLAADSAREKTAYFANLEIVNSFEPGGLENTMRELIQVVRPIIVG